tara:strand:+ start:341 stop:1192 length:852 start_codon:yes stop_codon:yes gene_type:complete
MNNIVFIADFFVDEMLGGGELNNEEFIKISAEKGYKLSKINSHLVNLDWLRNNEEHNYIISNFVGLRPDCKEYITKNLNYVIYEHDHKYLLTRNPAIYENFIAPKEHIINRDFYQRARAVLCQSKFHKDIIEKNLNFNNIMNLGGNIWSLEALQKMREYTSKDKRHKCSIMNSEIPHKNTIGAKIYCARKRKEYELIPALKYYDFLNRISNNDTLVFFPKTPETLSRIAVEARMMGMKVLTNNLVGATSEEWFKLKGFDLIDMMTNKREEIFNKTLGTLENAK